MAKHILVANWKNYPDSLEQAKSIVKGFSKKASVYKKLAVFIAPPYTYFESVSKLTRSFARLASQNIFAEHKTSTGEVSVDILKSFGVRLSIIGHSERRARGETNKIVAEKIKTAQRAGIVSLLCVGELEHDREGEHLEFIREELLESLALIRKKEVVGKLIIAYEPVWAIGKGAKDAMQPNDLSQMVIFIRKVLSDMFGRETASKIPILYGGSVGVSNTKGLLDAGINGFLVGRESLNPEHFAEIAKSLN